MNLRLLPYTPDRDVYQLLGVPATASTDEITAACRRLARTFHPDRNGSGRATEEMQVVNAVRSVLTDPQTRAVYDRERHRFLAEVTLRRPVGALRVHSGPSGRGAHPVRPIVRPRPGRPSSIGRYVRAAALGLRVVASELAPSRCRTCRIVIAREDAYCAACGTPLLTGG
jgi:curved DNA-binding protein CbpA